MIPSSRDGKSWKISGHLPPQSNFEKHLWFTNNSASSGWHPHSLGRCHGTPSPRCQAQFFWTSKRPHGTDSADSRDWCPAPLGFVLSLLNGYFIGGIPHFQTYPLAQILLGLSGLRCYAMLSWSMSTNVRSG